LEIGPQRVRDTTPSMNTNQTVRQFRVPRNFRWSVRERADFSGERRLVNRQAPADTKDVNCYQQRIEIESFPVAQEDVVSSGGRSLRLMPITSSSSFPVSTVV